MSIGVLVGHLDLSVAGAIQNDLELILGQFTDWFVKVD